VHEQQRDDRHEERDEKRLQGPADQVNGHRAAAPLSAALEIRPRTVVMKPPITTRGTPAPPHPQVTDSLRQVLRGVDGEFARGCS